MTKKDKIFPKQKQDRITLVKNIFSLGILQGSNYILPLLTIPYLVRVLGPDYFGLLAFATATITYIALLTDYGFNLSGTRRISIHRENNFKISKIFSAIMIIKLILLCIGFLLLILLIELVDKFNSNWEVYILTFGVVIGQVLFPIWLFQGIEKMKYITYVNILSKLFFTILIFLFVNDESDYILVPFFNSLGIISGSLFSLYLATEKMGYKFVWPGLKLIKFLLIDGWHVFISSMSISLYTVSTIFILGLLTNNRTVGEFAAVDKIIQAAKGIYNPIAQAIFPMVSRKFHEHRSSGFIFIKKIAKIVFLIFLILSLALFFFSNYIVNMILGDQFTSAVELLKIMAALPLITALSNILGVQVMINIGYKKAFTIILSIAAIVGVFLNFLLVPIYQEKGTALVLLTIEMFVTISMFFYIFLRSKLNGLTFKSNKPAHHSESK